MQAVYPRKNTILTAQANIQYHMSITSWVCRIHSNIMGIQLFSSPLFWCIWLDCRNKKKNVDLLCYTVWFRKSEAQEKIITAFWPYVRGPADAYANIYFIYFFCSWNWLFQYHHWQSTTHLVNSTENFIFPKCQCDIHTPRPKRWAVLTFFHFRLLFFLL